jgi:hypothetical protein
MDKEYKRQDFLISLERLRVSKPVEKLLLKIYDDVTAAAEEALAAERDDAESWKVIAQSWERACLEADKKLKQHVDEVIKLRDKLMDLDKEHARISNLLNEWINAACKHWEFGVRQYPVPARLLERIEASLSYERQLSDATLKDWEFRKKMKRFKGWRVIYIAKYRGGSLRPADTDYKEYRTEIIGREAARSWVNTARERGYEHSLDYNIQKCTIVKVFAKEKKTDG